MVPRFIFLALHFDLPCCMVPCCMLHVSVWGGEPATRHNFTVWTLFHYGVGSLLRRKFPLCGLVSMCELFVRWYHGTMLHHSGDPPASENFACLDHGFTVWTVLHFTMLHVAWYHVSSFLPYTSIFHAAWYRVACCMCQFGVGSLLPDTI